MKGKAQIVYGLPGSDVTQILLTAFASACRPVRRTSGQASPPVSNRFARATRSWCGSSTGSDAISATCSTQCTTSPPAESACAYSLAGRGDRHDDGRRQPRLRHLRRTRRVRARAHHRTHESRPRIRPRARTRRRAPAEDDGREAAARHGEHGQAGYERRRVLREGWDDSSDALSAHFAGRDAPCGRQGSAVYNAEVAKLL